MTGESPSPRPSEAVTQGPRLGNQPVVNFGSLVADLRSLGVQRGQDLLVHCSMRRIGPVDGGAATLLAAIQQVAGPAATIVVPTQTAWTSPTSREFRTATAGLDQDEYASYLAALPSFDPATTPSAGMGAFAEHVRTRRDAQRSAHPQTSFAAIGLGAAAGMSGHDPDCHLGERSPLRWLYDGDAAILLLGVGYAVCTAFHLAEYRISRKAPARGAELDDSDFRQLGAALDATWRSGARFNGSAQPGTDGAPSRRRVGMKMSRRVPVRTAVDFAVSWLTNHRNYANHDT
jgi:aminoglycoside 3-N-acetyltransferase